MPAPEVTAGESEVALRERLSSLQGLLVLSILMTESGDERGILRLLRTSVPTLTHCRLRGVHLSDEGWRAASGACAEAAPRGAIEAALASLGVAGGPIALQGDGWGWAYPLRGPEGRYGNLVVADDKEPPADRLFLLRVLSQQTGMALANARLHRQERRAAEDLRKANAALAAAVTVLERSTAIHERLTRTALAGTGEAGLVQAVHELTGYAVAAEDRHGNPQAWAGPGRPDPYPKRPIEEREALLRRARRQGAPVRSDGRLVAVAWGGEEVLGVLGLIDPDGTAGEQEQVAMEHGATVLALVLARMHGLAESQLRLGRDLVEALLVGDEEVAASRARALDYDLARLHRVVALKGRAPGGDEDAFLQAARRAVGEVGVGSLVASRDGDVVVIASADRPWERLREAILAELRGGTCRVGVGGLCKRPGELPRSHQEARFALRMQDVAAGDEPVTSFETLGVYRLFSEAGDLSGVERFVEIWLGPLIEYDARRNSELVHTLSRYFASGGRYSDASRALSVHRSTLKYRLRRISEISGHDLGDPDTAFNMQLAVRAWQTLEALRGKRPPRPPGS